MRDHRDGDHAGGEQASSAVSRCGSATSMMSRSRNGEPRPTSEDSGDEQADQDEAAGVGAEEAEDPAGIHVGVVRADVGEWGHAVS